MSEVVPQTAPASEPAVTAPAAAPEVKPAEGAEPAPAAETKADQNAEPANTGDPGAAPADEPKVKLSELIAQRKRRQEAERRVAYLEGKLEGSQHPAAPAAKPKSETPQFTPLEEYDGPYEDWLVAKTKFELKHEQEQYQRQQEVKSREEAMHKQWSESFKTAATEIPDLEEVITSQNQPFPVIPDMVANAIIKSGFGPQIIYFMHKNPAEGIRLAQMEPELAIMELAGIREKAKVFVTPKIKKATTAAPPLNPGNGGGVTVDTDLADLPMEQYMAKREQETYVRVGGKLVPQ